MKRLIIALLLTTAPSVALAQDGDELDVDLLDGEEEDSSDDKKRLDSADDVDFEWDESEADETELGEEHNAEDLLGGEGQNEGGADDGKTYQKAKEAVADMPPDEEVIYWERYLEVYPDSTFKDRIDKRIAELMDEVYDERVPTRVGVDAGSSTFKISQSLEGESIKPMQRLRFGFGWGLPNYLQLMVDYEHKVRDNLSVHGGIRNRYTGASLELGAHWAFVQSERTQTVVALLGDARVNANPAYIALRPQLAFGKKFGDKLDLQVQQGVELEARSPAGLRLVGLGNVSYRINETVGAFVESSYEMKNLTWADGGVFAFQVVSFGIKFYPSGGSMKQGQMEAMLGASAPAAANYWGYHVGAIAGQGSYYFE
ncbi:MAG: hypothetical protein EP330_19830 [Deltaproteobacteria bacterium]|nr:MAG: hypothetical protein EP330_19830 [Deltaproteobacteria bacterium]